MSHIEEGSLPPGWAWTTVGSLLAEPPCNGLSVKASPDQRGVAALRLNAMQAAGFDYSRVRYLPVDWANVDDIAVRLGDFFVSRGNGSLALVGRGTVAQEPPFPVIFPDTMIRLRLLEPFAHTRWMAAIWPSRLVRRQIEARVKTTAGIYKLSQPELLSIRVPLPPVQEQHRVVAELDKHFSRLDAAVAALKRAQASLKRYRAAVLQAAVEGRLLDEAKSVRLVNGHPSTWQLTSLGEVAEIQGGIQKQPSRRPVRNHFPFLRVANVLRGRLDLAEIHRIELFDGELDRLRLQRGDLLVVEGNGSAGEIGRMSVWGGEIEDCVHQNHLIRARLHGDLEPAFVSVYWASPLGRRRVASVASSTSGLYTLSVGKLARLPVPLPPSDVQRTIVRLVEQEMTSIDATERQLHVCLVRAERLRYAVLADGLSGRLVPQDPHDEPASVLLDRVRSECVALTPARRKITRRKPVFAGV